MEVSEKIKIHWIIDSTSPYNADLFREIHSVTKNQFYVYFHNLNSQTHFWKSDLISGYNSRKLKGILSEPLIRLAIQKLNPCKPEIFLIAGWNNVFNILFMCLLMLRKKRFVILSDTPNLSRKSNFFKSKLRNKLLNFFFKHSYKILTTGRPAVNAFVKLGADKTKIVNFPYWIQLSKYRSHVDITSIKTTDAKSHFIFVSSGRIINHLKGYDISLRALEIVSKKMPRSCDFEFRIIGDGQDVKKLRYLSEQLHLDNKVKFLGWMEPDEVISELTKAHFFLHSSPVHEPYGVVIIEAMAVGLVVFASDNSMAAIDRIQSGDNGFVYPSGDYEFLAQQILDLFANYNSIKEISEQAVQTSLKWPMSMGVDIVKNIGQ
jgi:glycosyltransferase involved in cell wall biosynthesis